jgi:hypothetical protein
LTTFAACSVNQHPPKPIHPALIFSVSKSVLSKTPNFSTCTKHQTTSEPSERGFADVWKKGCFAWEYKGKKKNLDEAYKQILRYRESLLNPTLLVVCDFDRYIVKTNFNGTVHHAPSTVGIDTRYKSQSEIPDKFLRDAGVSEEAIELARSIRCGPPIQWNSCFISYSTKDDDFARQLHSCMREANMRVWFAPEDLKGGKKLHEQLFDAVQVHDRLLLVLSEHNIQSEWVMTEKPAARRQFQP